MRGIVYKTNPESGVVACQTDQGSFTIFKILNGNAVKEGNEIFWENSIYLGLTMITGKTLNETFEVYMLNHCADKDEIDR